MAAREHRDRRWVWLAASVVAAVCVFVYRYASHAGFSNDHFIHLSRALAMLSGDWPIRDYMEEGVPLTVLLSAGAQLVWGRSPYAELVLTVGAMAVAAGVACWLTCVLTRSGTLGLGAAALQGLARPRLYSYPKILLYPILTLLAWRYLEKPTRPRLFALALITAVAFLIRHDHGVYVGLGACTAVVVGTWPLGLALSARRVVEFGLLALLCVTPYLAYVQYEGGIVPYFRNGIAISQTEAARTSRVHADFEPLPHGAWLDNTNGSLRMGPKLEAALDARHQAVLLYWLSWTLLGAAFTWVLVRGLGPSREPVGRVLVLAAIITITTVGLFRESLETRAPDVYGLLPVLVLWAAAGLWRVPLSWRPLRWVAGTAAAAMVAGVAVATAQVGDAKNAVPLSGLPDGPSAVSRRVDAVTHDARTYPWARQWPAGNGFRVARYVRDCTRPDDRLLVTWNKPEMNVWAQRAFASGETLLVPALRPPAMFASAALARIRRQSIPVILVQPSTYAQDFERLYPEIASFIDERYEKVGHFGNDERDDVDVYVERSRTPTGRDVEFDWPCFR